MFSVRKLKHEVCGEPSALRLTCSFSRLAGTPKTRQVIVENDLLSSNRADQQLNVFGWNGGRRALHLVSIISSNLF